MMMMMMMMMLLLLLIIKITALRKYANRSSTCISRKKNAANCKDRVTQLTAELRNCHPERQTDISRVAAVFGGL